ncbi:MAG: hypothetical protein Q4G16_04100 [Cruoricaptor ignavus]|nr:hypothetical protein [Cruoricaptor ignavus]
MKVNYYIILLMCFSLNSIKNKAAVRLIEKDSIAAKLYSDISDNFENSLLVTNNYVETDQEIGKAILAFKELDNNDHYVERINPNELTEFPIGLRENKSSVEYGIVVTKAKFTPEYAVLDVYARVVTPQTGAEGGKRTLYFGAEGVKLSYEGRIMGDAKLSMLGDVYIPFNKNQWVLVLEGGKISKADGESYNDNTYLTIDCYGVKELSLKGNIQISRDVIVPIDDKGMLLPKERGDGQVQRVRGDFSIKVSDWNDLLVNVSLTPFAITSQVQHQDKGFFLFFVNNAILDLSDLRTDPNVVFPKYYNTHGYLIAGRESWRGLYVQSLYVGLPQEFKTKDDIDTRASFQAQNLLIDSYGVSGSFSANNVISIDKGITNDQNGWRYSVDKISIDLAASKIVGADLKGEIQLPIQKQNSNSDTSTTNLGYEGVITDDEYLISVSTINQLEFDVWSAKATILQGSSVALNVRNRRFYPKAVLNGTMELRANADANDNLEDKKDAHFTGVKFEGLTLQTEGPYITADYFGVQGEQRLAGFPASIKNIFITAGENYANLNFNITIGLQEERFSASGDIKIKGEITSENHFQTWKYNGFELTELKLSNVDIGVATVSGSLELMRKDPLYGNGFKVLLNAKIDVLQNVEIGVNAVFGYSTFRYWGFEGNIHNLNIPVGGAIKITGFTGGAFYRMVPNRDMGLSYKNKALVMTPDESIGLALRAGVYGAIKNKSVASFMAGFNISTNANGGLANVGFIGEATIMSDFSSLIPIEPFEALQDKFRNWTGNSKFLNDLKNEKHIKTFLDIADVEEQYPLSNSVEGTIYGKLAMNYDFNNSIFHANLDVFINIANGVIKGTGQNGRAGNAVLHIAPNDWYLHIGKPSEMVGLRVGFDKFYVQAGSYFMVGSRIPGSPPPPAKIAEILGVELDNIDYMKNLNQLGEGNGFAFGSHFSFDTGDMTALFLYARFQAGLGTDIMLKNYGTEAKCTNRGGDQIGINGWYANGQAYVYLQGELGIKIKLWFAKKKIPIIQAGAATLLQARGPNPYWARGYLGGYYNLLSGLVKGKFRFKLEFGEECQLEKESVLGDMKIIADFTPRKGATEVDVFAVPQATFSVRVNEPIVIPEDDGDHTYKVILDKMAIIDEQGNEIAGDIEYNNAKDVANFISDDILPPNKNLKAVVQVSFMEKKNGLYQVVMVDGKKATEIEERSFTTGTSPSTIPLSNIVYAYPIVEQENYYKGETNNGYIKLKRGQDYLFDDPVWVTSTQFINNNNTQITDFSYNNDTNTVNFTIPDLVNQKEVTLSIIAKNSQQNESKTETKTVVDTKSDGNENSSVTTQITTKVAQDISKDGVIERLTYTFKTSKYNTFSQKLSALNFTPLWLKINSDVVNLQNNMNTDEYFDKVELVGTKYTDNKPLVELTAFMDDAFAQKIRELVYDPYPIDGIALSRANNQDDFAGIPPIKGFSIFTSYLDYLETDKGKDMLKQTFPYTYNLFGYYKADWYETVSKAAAKYMDIPMNSRPAGINTLLESTYGIIPKTKYKVKASYKLPGNKKGTETNFYYEYR